MYLNMNQMLDDTKELLFILFRLCGYLRKCPYFLLRMHTKIWANRIILTKEKKYIFHIYISYIYEMRQKSFFFVLFFCLF